MTQQEIVELLRIAERRGIPVWIDGGWGVDALLGRQTRPHNDADLVIERRNAEAFVAEIIRCGYCEVVVDYTTPSHTVWQTEDDRIVDLHLIEFDEAGIAHYEGESYPPGGLDATGTIGGVSVRCVSAEAQLLFHQGYEHTRTDVHDVLLLCERFDLPVPEQYVAESRAASGECGSC
ncbi:MAG: aminoglycoside nucleotidyltransferase [candidate division WS1 bacterium]|nr:aminoglycoside nucleotidyltransferase [candidate division WS1 bacterium]